MGRYAFRSVYGLWHMSIVDAAENTAPIELEISAGRPQTDLRPQARSLDALSNANLQDIHNNDTFAAVGNCGEKLQLRSFIKLRRAPLSLFELSIKRAIDIVFAAAALIVLLPLLILVAIAIKLSSPGRVIFRQTRHGLHGEPFQILKFRTMTVEENGDSIKQATRLDDRVTRVGSWLRCTSVDELPQLINVLKGEMSLVGPRPHAAAHDNYFSQIVTNYALRRRIKPGITGFAQVNGCRGETSTVASIQRRVDLDLWYIDHWSFRLDLAIMVSTVIEIIRGRDAY